MQTGLPPHQRPRALTHAFTLVELLAVIGIMVLLLSFTLPALRSGGNLNKTAWDIAGVVEQAQAYAQAQNTYTWVGFNEADVSDSNGTRRLSVFVMASRDGTSNVSNAATLGLLDKLRTFDNVSLETANTNFTGTTNGYGTRPTGSTVKIVGGSGGNVTFAITSLPKRMVGTTSTTLSNGNNRVLQIAPDGSVSYPGVNNMHWFELLLQTKRNSINVEGDTAVIQISALTGRARVLRPGVNTTAADTP